MVFKTGEAGDTGSVPFVPLAPVVQTFLSSALYTPTPGTLYTEFIVVGAGSGGCGSSNGTFNAGTAGGNTTVGGTIIVANGGPIAGSNNFGGTGSITAPAVGNVFTGNAAQTETNFAGAGAPGACGAAGPFGGAGAGRYNAAGQPGTSYGAGGAGGGCAGGIMFAAPGGNAGGMVKARINNPTPMAIVIGAAGFGGAGSGGGFNGAAGFQGIVIAIDRFQ